MVGVFSEIEEFFQQKQFTQEQLDKLKDAIEINYKDNLIRKQATSAVTIKLLQYKMSGPLVARTSENRKRDRIRLNTKKATTSGKAKKYKKKKISDRERTEAFLANSKKDVVDIFYEHNINKPIRKAAIYLKMPLDKFLNRLIVPGDITINENSRLTEDVWNYNSDWISFDLRRFQEKFNKKERKSVIKSRKKSKEAKGVYGKLAQTKNIGPIIYNRM